MGRNHSCAVTRTAVALSRRMAISRTTSAGTRASVPLCARSANKASCGRALSRFTCVAIPASALTAAMFVASASQKAEICEPTVRLTSMLFPKVKSMTKRSQGPPISSRHGLEPLHRLLMLVRGPSDQETPSHTSTMRSAMVETVQRQANRPVIERNKLSHAIKPQKYSRTQPKPPCPDLAPYTARIPTKKRSVKTRSSRRPLAKVKLLSPGR